ncbi:unnamed protein product [Allacma fusca]|uniref:ATP-dependent DNA helicase n=1 Tax=Allacma fusca TaxID=39272 RepID=A0A8J2KSS9_9HEXA|nr:unnamed protein product [Allacma fusca]
MRIEFQGRGSGHVHCLFFNPEAPTFNDEGFIPFLNSNVSCSTTTSLRDIVIKYQTHRHTSCCYKGTHNQCRFNFPKPECKDTAVLSEEQANANKGRFINLTRSKDESMINNYHPILLQALKCNIDIQAVTNEMSIAYYVAKYMSKSEPEAIRVPLRNVIAVAQENINENPRRKLFKQTKEIMRLRELGSQEAAFRACRLPLHKSSHATVFVPAFKRENRTRMVNKYTISSGNPSFCLNIIDKYKLRPQTPLFENICLFEFVAMYQVLSKNSGHTNMDEDYDEEFVEEVQNGRPKYTLLHGKGYVQRRMRHAIVKFPNFNPLTQTENYYYSILLLYLPFREEDFTNGYTSSALAFQHHFNSLRSTSDNSIIQLRFSDELNRCIIILAEALIDDENECEMSESLEDFFDDDDNVNINTVDAVHNPELFNAEEHLKQVASLSPEQKRIFSSITSSFNVRQEPKRIIAMGSGGVGKSYLIKIICNHIKFLTFGDLNNPVVVAAPTGVAARAIKGTTLHKAFKLPVEKTSAVQHKPLKGQCLQNLRNSLKNLKLVIIDEFSV